MDFSGMTRNQVENRLRRGGFQWFYWNDLGTELEADRTFAGVTVNRLIVHFNDNGKACCAFAQDWRDIDVRCKCS